MGFQCLLGETPKYGKYDYTDQISLNNTNDNSVYSDINTNAMVPLQIESGLAVLTRSTPAKAQARVVHTSTMRQQFT